MTPANVRVRRNTQWFRLMFGEWVSCRPPTYHGRLLVNMTRSWPW